MLAVIDMDSKRVMFYLPSPTEEDWQAIQWGEERGLYCAVYVG